MMFGNFAFPFSETAAMSVASRSGVSPAAALHVDVWSFWLPMMLGSAIALYGLSGHLSLKYRHAAFLLPFGGLAVIFLIWQVEVSQMLSNIAYKEEFTILPGQTHLNADQAIHHEMFKMSYGQFTEMLDATGCTISGAKGRPGLRPVQVDCKEDSMEAKLLQITLTQFCRPHTVDKKLIQKFDRRVEVCKQQGAKLDILESDVMPREDAYCRCRTVVYDWLQVMSRWSMVIWFWELFGVCAVFYFAVEPNLARMDPRARKEFLFLAALGIAVLAGRVTLFDGELVRMQQAVESEG